ncbi:transglycosylase SLT domain-containing protein [Pontibaca methylaminivorans]|uniref:Transglycosylase SLT domain-containing protein n=1 Tax=Pontibaca methylaminivorans TaxID=515897 RepID=A0A1R3WW26_9RHOB|nr:lytic transglycosylase [Pontibaca methylaminivorans]SIT82270.1 hypothetical protein SAMN05421849_1656 [Pontibaca methylaminivorans]
MSRFIWATALAVLLASCGARYQPPHNMDDACSIATERPKYMRAFKAAERKWGVPVHVQMATIYHESSFRGNARTPFRYVLGILPVGRQSSAYGYSQALDGTWDDYRAATGKRRARRDRMDDAADFIGWYMTKSRDRNGIALTDARNQYLAYHEGHSGYARGSHNAKSWLLRTSGNVESRSAMYARQLASCSR